MQNKIIVDESIQKASNMDKNGEKEAQKINSVYLLIMYPYRNLHIQSKKKKSETKHISS